MPAIGLLSARTPELDAPFLATFRRGLNEGGYIEGKNVAIELRWGGERSTACLPLAQELVRRQAALIVTFGGLARRARPRTPHGHSDRLRDRRRPVKFGLVDSLSRPGGNSPVSPISPASWLQSSLGCCAPWCPGRLDCHAREPGRAGGRIPGRAGTGSGASHRAAAPRLRAGTERDIDVAFATLVAQRAGALLLGANPFFAVRKNQLVALASRHAIPTLYWRSELAEREA